MLRRITRRLQHDEGLTLVEMMVAVLILGVVLTATASVMIGAFTTIARAESRTKATALANEELENMRALPWRETGFYADDYDDEDDAPNDTVFLDPERPTDPTATRAPLPVVEVERGGTTFTVERQITWAEEPEELASTQGMKRLRVVITWTDRGQPASRQAETVRAPDPGEYFSLSIGEIEPTTYFEIDATGKIIGDLEGNSFSQMRFNATTSARADFVWVTYQRRNGAMSGPIQLIGQDGVVWSRIYDQGSFPNGDVVFTFRAQRSFPVEQEVVGNKTVRFVQAFALRSLTVSQTSICVPEGAQAPELTVTIEVEGITAEDIVEVRWGNQDWEPAEFVDAFTEGSRFTYVIEEGSYSSTFDVEARAERDKDNAGGQFDDPVTVTVQGPEDC